MTKRYSQAYRNRDPETTDYLIPWSRVLLEKLTVTDLVKKLPKTLRTHFRFVIKVKIDKYHISNII